MKELHESGLFFCKGSNGLLTARLPAEVESYKVYMQNGRVIDIFGKKIFYFKDLEVLEIKLHSGAKKFFQYRLKKDSFVEIDECAVA